MTKLGFTKFNELNYIGTEAMNKLCANLSYLGGDLKKIMVTSTRPGEGKSFISMNLMRSFANLGMRVLLIDADLRASVLYSTYGMRILEGKTFGLTRYLAGMCSIDEIVLGTDIPNADMILVGKNIENAFTLLNSPRLKKLFDEMVKRYDLIIVDAPPIGTIIDAATIAAHCDGTLFVVQSGAIRQKELRNSITQMERAGSTILGVVLNKYRENAFSKYYYSKSYYYNKKYTADSKRR